MKRPNDGTEDKARSRPDLWRRYLALMIDGLRPEAARELPVPALSAVQMVEATTG